MFIKELIKQYNFHDSLIEQMELKDNTLKLELELYNWKQEICKDEIINLTLLFKDIKNFEFDATKKEFDCDSVVDFLIEKEMNDLYCAVKIVLDGDDNIKIIKFIGKEVDIC